MTNTKGLFEAVKAVCPIESISYGKRSDKSTWRIDFLPEATKAQKDAARAVVAAFDPAAPPPKSARGEKIDALVAKGKLDPEVADLLR